MRNHRIAQSLVAVACATGVTLGVAGPSYAAGTWHKKWTTNGKSSQHSKAYHVSKGKHFLHFGIKGNGRTKFTATLYKKVKGKDPVIQRLKNKPAKNVEWMADWKSMSAGEYYISWKYPKKGHKAFGGVG
ncbi:MULTISPECIES: hypothetical protein [Streptomyces]|uniref:hypothetical protein n=1 Tax=Streptomyces TaxID=1883 RepID=UPI001E522568|nr:MULTISPECIES: hypothetical protein [Streptomyces]UFQ15561.1 hypothetical protein J2N69_11455 [Streptomyces huasconensis]WCL85163.1 hypothetical protein PPN52_11465 [Streptomyces sp. JCM 35825]